MVGGSPERLPLQHGASQPLLRIVRSAASIHGDGRMIYRGCIVALAAVALVSVVLLGGLGQSRITVLKDIALLPNGWTEALDTNHKKYYYNQKLGLSSWDPPKGAVSAPTTAATQTSNYHNEQSAAALPIPSAQPTKPAAAAQKAIAAAVVQPTAQASSAPVYLAQSAPVTAEIKQSVQANDVAVDTAAMVNQQPYAHAKDTAAMVNQQPYAQDNLQGADKAMPPYFARSRSLQRSAAAIRSNNNVDSDDFDDDIPNGLADNDKDPDWSSDSMDEDSGSDDEVALGDGSDSLTNQNVGRSPEGFHARQQAPHVSTLADSDVPKAEKISDISTPADWPKELPGAVGDGPSWIVGMHREPLWSDSYQGCSPFEYCDKDVADKGHKFQRTVNPYVDKRRTFDPYAMTTQEGRNEYPWDPTKDPQVYGTGDCSDGNLKDECWKKPSKNTLQDKQDALRKQNDEFYPDNIRAGYRESAEKAEKAEFAKHGLGPDGQPLPVSTRDAYAYGGGASLRARRGGPRFVGGRPVADTLGTILRKVDRQVPATQKTILHDLARDGGSMLHDVVRLITSMFAPSQPTAPAATELLSRGAGQGQARLVSAGKAGSSREAAKGKAAKGKAGKDVSIWESPLMVEAKGLFGIKDGKDSAHGSKGGAKRAQKAAATAAEKAAGGATDPLAPISAEVMRVVEGSSLSDDVKGKAGKAAVKAASKKKLAGWQEQTMQKGALRRESTATNLQTAVREHDDRLLQARTGFSPGDLAAIEKDADAVEKAEAAKHGEKKEAAPAAKRKGAVSPWEEKEIQKGALRRESVEDNLKAALSARELKLLEKQSGWHSEADLAKAEKFAENLQRAIASRRREEAAHPLVPAAAKSALDKRDGEGGEAVREEAGQKKKELSSMEWEVVHNNEVRVVQRIREEEPIVKAYEAQVKNDEREFKDEVAEEDDTLTRLRKDQTKLAAAVQKQGAPVDDGTHFSRTRAPRTRRADDLGDESAAAASAAAGDVGDTVASAGAAAATGSAGRGAAAAADAMSARAADKDLDSYFDSMAPSEKKPAA